MQNDMVTLNNSTEQSGQGRLIFSQEDSHASRTVQPGSEKAKKMTATSGLKCLESLEKFNQPTSWAKMFTALLIGRGDWYSTKCKLTWRMLATRSHRLYFRLVVSTLRTDATEFGLLHTPRVVMIKETNENFQRRMADRCGTTYPHLINQVVDYVEKGLLPTATAREYKGGRHPETLKSKGRAPSNSLGDTINAMTGKCSPLNPLFVEEMMGYPPTWTWINESRPSETPSSRKSRSKSSKQ